MNILIVYYSFPGDRVTIKENLNSFKNYSNESCFYVDARYKIPSFIAKINFDLVIYHYTFLSMKWNGKRFFNSFLKTNEVLKKVSGYKIAIPQDEYVHSRLLCKFFRDYDVKTVYTCFTKKDWIKAYPKSLSGVDEFFTVLPGYIDDKTARLLFTKSIPHTQRRFDIGYRARKVPFWLGSHGTAKWRLTEIFNAKVKHTKLKTSLSNDEKDVIYGKEWYQFLLQCRVVLGCESGASMHDPDGKIRKKTELLTRKNPNLNFDQVKKACFANDDNNISLFCISPRHFEASMAKTCQALVEGSYSGILKKDVHYINIKSDYSNINEVLYKISDKKYCEEMANRTYKDIVESKKYTYSVYVQNIIRHFKKKNHIRLSQKHKLKNTLLIHLFFVYLPIHYAYKDTFSKIPKFTVRNIKLNLGIRRFLKKYLKLKL